MYKIHTKRLLMRSILIHSILCFLPQVACAEFWNLPQALSPANTSITFEVDSTWHLVKGTVKNFSGELWVADSNNFQSVRGNIRLPVSEFDTESESRDERMLEVMNAKQNPFVVFSITGFDGQQCSPQTLIEKSPCVSSISGNLTINNNTKPVVLKTEIEKIGATYHIVGTTSIKWADYKVEDPSILIAKLYEDVNIHIRISLSERN